MVTRRRVIASAAGPFGAGTTLKAQVPATPSGDENAPVLKEILGELRGGRMQGRYFFKFLGTNIVLKPEPPEDYVGQGGSER